MPITAKLRFFNRPQVPVILWLAAAIIIPFIQFVKGSYNNYKIFKGAFYHLINKQHLYAEYPADYFDTNHYGPFFGVLIAPFALLPDLLGMILWSLLNTWLLYKAIKMLPVADVQKTWILWICFVELTTAQHSLQINPAITAWIILTFVFIHTKKAHWAALFALLGFFVKLYGIVALAFGVFSRRRWTLFFFVLLWAVVLFVLPMIFSSPQFISTSYNDWMQSLTHKNTQNTELQLAGNMQNISVMGMITRIFQLPDLPLWSVLLSAALLMLAPLLRFRWYRSLEFQLYYLSAVLLSIVLFSTGSESPTFIIAVTGAAIFFVIQQRPWHPWIVFLVCFLILLTCLSPTDIFPRVVRKQFIQPYALKALPCFLIWLTIIYQLLTKKLFNFEIRE